MDDAADGRLGLTFSHSDTAGAAAEADIILPPLVPTRPRANGWTPQRQRDFLEALASCGSVGAAARRVGMSRESAYALRRRADARGFAQAWDAARLLAAEHLVDLAWDRAVEGELRPLVYHGEVVGEVRHYDNRLLLGLIAQNRKVLVEQGLVAPPEVTAAAALDWEAALERAERGEALEEVDVLRQAQDERGLGVAQDELVLRQAQDERCLEQEGVPPPLPAERDLDGEVMDEAQQLEVGLYRFHYAPDGESLLTNWPAPEGVCGQWYRVASDEAEAEPIARDPADPAMADDGEEWPGLEEAFRALLPPIGLRADHGGGGSQPARRQPGRLLAALKV